MNKYPEKFQTLLTYGREGLMRTKKYTMNYLELGFNEDDIALLTEMVFDEELNSLIDNEENEDKLFAPVHAVMVLGQLKAEKPFKLLLASLDIDDDDYYRSAVTYYLKTIGNPFVAELTAYFLDETKNLFNRMLVLEAMEQIDEKSDNTVSMLEETMVHYLTQKGAGNDGLNAMAIAALKEITGTKHIDLIRNVYRNKPVDIWFYGDLEDLEIELGLREKRETPKPSIFDMFDFKPEEILQLSGANEKIGRNDPCPCGSGKKYKKCCMGK